MEDSKEITPENSIQIKVPTPYELTLQEEELKSKETKENEIKKYELLNSTTRKMEWVSAFEGQTDIISIGHYLAQLCLKLRREPTDSQLCEYITNTAANYPNIGLRALWIINAYYKELLTRKIVNHELRKLSQKIESVLVNGAKIQYLKNQIVEEESVEGILDQSREKMYREEYLNSFQLPFVGTLSTFSLYLKKKKETERTAHLFTMLTNMNDWIKSHRTKNFPSPTKYANYYKGIILPINEKDDLNPTLILGGITEEGVCFNTHSRTPIKIVFECIALWEAREWEYKIELMKEDEDCVITPEGFVNLGVNAELDNENLGKLEEGERKHQGIKEYVRQMTISEGIRNSPGDKRESDTPESQFVLYSRTLLLNKSTKNSNKIEDNIYINEEIKEVLEGNEGEIKVRKNNLNSQDDPQDNPHSLSFVLIENENEVIPLDIRLDGMADPFPLPWSQVKEKYKSLSPYRRFDTYDLKAFIFKGGDDLRQEHMAIQFIKRLKDICVQEGVNVFLHPYEVIVTGYNSGYIEFISDTITVDCLKKKFPSSLWGLDTFYRKYFYDHFEEAQKHFVESLAGYSLLCYILNIKDRHNANILIHRTGRIMHIDFGFFLSSNPGGVNFETAHFKLTREYVDVMDGPESAMFYYFKSLMLCGLNAARNYQNSLCEILEAMIYSKFPCFAGGPVAINELRKRLNLYNIEETNCMESVDKLIDESFDHPRTKKYDSYQKFSNGIFP